MITLIGLSWTVNELINMEHIEQCLCIVIT